jgi:HEAT repeat protein
MDTLQAIKALNDPDATKRLNAAVALRGTTDPAAIAAITDYCVRTQTS